MKRLKNQRVTAHQINLISKVERFQGTFEATKFQRPALIDSLKKTSIITSSGASTRIEGAVLEDEQVQELIEKGCQINNLSSRSEREVAGYVKALNYIYDQHTSLKVTEKNIRELHQLLTSELTEEQLPLKQRGAYKDITNDVVETDNQTGKTIKVWFKTTPPGPATETAMASLLSDYQELNTDSEYHPLVCIAGFVVHFLAIHPFRDGNGRLSRLLTTLLLLRHGYQWAQYTSHEKVIEDNKENYYVSLRETQSSFNTETPHYEPWLDYLLSTVEQQVEFLKRKLIMDSPTTVMNKNEKIVFQLIEGAGECKISYLDEHVDMSRPGLKSLLKRMIGRGLIQTNGVGKGTTYSLKR